MESSIHLTSGKPIFLNVLRTSSGILRVSSSDPKQKLAPAHEELLRHGYLTNVSYSLTQEGEDKVIYNFTDGGSKMEGNSVADTEAASQLVFDFYAQLTGTHELTYEPTPKEVALAQDYLATYGPERSAFAVRHALQAARAVDFPIQTFGGTRNFLPQALAAWERYSEVEEARREENVRVAEQLHREREERERRQRLADKRAALSDEALAALRHRAEEALAVDGVDRTHLGYDVLVKLKMDDVLEHEGHLGQFQHHGRR